MCRPWVLLETLPITMTNRDGWQDNLYYRYFLGMVKIKHTRFLRAIICKFCNYIDKGANVDIIIIIIILPWLQHRYPWHSLATPPCYSSPMAAPQDYTPYPHRAAACKFELVALLLLGNVRGSIGEHHVWARPCFSSSVLHVWFV